MLSVNISELIWGVINFFLLYFLLKRFLFKPLISFMDERNERICSGLEAEKAALEEQSRQQAEAETLCSDKRIEAEEYIKKARNEAESQHRANLIRAQQEAVYAQMHFAENEKRFCDKAQAELSARKADLAAKLAEKILQS